MVHAFLRKFFVYIYFSPEYTFTTRQEENDTEYDEVTEDQYKSIVKGRLQRDGFVVDDGGWMIGRTGVDVSLRMKRKSGKVFTRTIDISEISLTFF